MNRLLFLFAIFCFALSSPALEGFIKTRQITTGGGTQSFTYSGNWSPSTTFSLTDTQINFSGPITSGITHVVTQTVPPNWSVTSISCVCYQSNAPGNDPSAPCQSTWTPDLVDADVFVNLVGQELVECTFVDTQNPCTGPSCPVCGNGVVEAGEQCDDGNTASGDGCSSTCIFEGEVDIHQISASGTSQAFTYQASYSGSTITLTDGQVNSSGFISSFQPYSITQTNIPAGWLVTNISCVCSQLPTSPNDINAPCQSTWTPDIPHSAVNIILHGAEKVVCTFVDTLNPCTGTGCVASCGNGVLDPGEQCDNGVHNSNTAFGPGECTAQCTIPLTLTPTECAAKALALYNSCDQLPGRTSEVSVMLMILAALFWLARAKRTRVL